MASILSESAGYFILVGVGLLMAAAVTIMVKAETKWLGTKKTSEWFYTAGRTIKTGLIAASIVSAWTWAATLLQSSTVTFEFGAGGAFWYAAGACIQVVLFSVLAIELKRRAPMTHTFPEMLYVRFGRHAHKVFLFFALMTNTIVTAMLILGGYAAVVALTGVDDLLAVFLMPVGIVAYTIFGGLKATFFAEYLNVVTIFVVVLVFVAVAYFASPQIGGIEGMYEKVSEAALLNPVEGNAAGAYLTLASTGALIFGIINIVGNFGTIFVDQSYWQRAIAARTKSAAPGFIVGGLAWFAIPFALATALGLSAVAIGVELSPEEIDSGLVAPTTASILLGDLGAVLILTILFTAVTAAGSSQLISVSSLVTYDIYRTYLRPAATGRQLIQVSRVSILVFGMGLGLLASALLDVGASLQYIYLLMGILIGPAVAPISLGILWKKTSTRAATAAPLVGMLAGITTWLYATQAIYGEINISTTGNLIPLLAGNVVSILSGLAVAVLGSLARPASFDFDSMKQEIRLVDEQAMSRRHTDEMFLARASKRYILVGLLISLILVVVLPLSLYFTGYVFTPVAFGIWIYAAIIWAVAAAGLVILLPLVEARHSIMEIFRRADPAIEEYDEQQIKVLVPVDGSANSLRALTHARKLLAGSQAARLYVINVIDDDADAEKMREEGMMVLRSVVHGMDNCEPLVSLGKPSSQIVQMAEKLGIDIIVMGRRGIGTTGAPLGSVAEGVAGHSSKPVTVVG